MCWGCPGQGKTDRAEPVYGTEYAQEPVPGDWLDRWREAACDGLHLPHLNPFIPTDFTMLQVKQARHKNRNFDVSCPGHTWLIERAVLTGYALAQGAH